MKTIDDIVQIGVKNKQCIYETGVKKVNDYLKLLNIDTDEFYEMVKSLPQLLGYDIISDKPTSVKSKLKFYKDTLSLIDSELAKLIKSFPVLLSYDTISDKPTSVKSKLKFYKNTLSLTDNELAKLIKSFPVLLGFDTMSDSPTSVKSKLKFYKDTLSLTDSELTKFIKSFPVLLGYDTISNNPTSVKSKLNFYKNTLSLSDSELTKLIQSYPSLLSHDTVSDKPTSIKSKLKFYKDTLSLTDSELAKLIKSFPTLLGYDIVNIKEARTGIKVKLALLKQMGIEKETILENPILLAYPATRIRFRFMMLKQAYDKDTTSKSRYMMQSEDVLYARLRLILSKNDPNSLVDMIRGEQSFAKKYGVSSAQLKQKYPIDERAIDFVEKLYNTKNPDDNWHLTPIERKAVLNKTKGEEYALS